MKLKSFRFGQEQREAKFRTRENSEGGSSSLVVGSESLRLTPAITRHHQPMACLHPNWHSFRHEHGSVLDMNSGSGAGKTLHANPQQTPKQGVKTTVKGVIGSVLGMNQAASRCTAPARPRSPAVGWRSTVRQESGLWAYKKAPQERGLDGLTWEVTH